jgi:hypothetical protein
MSKRVKDNFAHLSILSVYPCSVLRQGVRRLALPFAAFIVSGDRSLEFKQLKDRIPLGYFYEGSGLGTGFQREISLYG